MEGVELLGEVAPSPATDGRQHPNQRRVIIAIGAVVGLLVVVAVWGTLLEQVGGADLHLGAVPFYGSFGWQATWSIVLPVAAAGLIVTAAPAWSRRAGWRLLLAGSWAATVAWSVLLGASAGWSALSSGLTSRYDYLPALPAARALGLGRFLQTYVERLGSYPVHVQGHPPGMVALLWLLDVVGLRGQGWEAVAIILIGATTPVAVLLAARAVAGAHAARAAAPFLVLAPWTLFVATIGDAVFTATAAWTIALIVLASRRDARAPHLLAALGGAAAALTLHLTYGLVPLLVVVPGAVLVARRRLVLVLPAAAGAVAVTAAWVAAGFWWLDGFQATRHWHDVGASVDRPYVYFLIADLAVLAVMLGPAVIAGLTVRPGRGAGSAGGLDPGRRSRGRPLRAVEGRGGADLDAVHAVDHPCRGRPAPGAPGAGPRAGWRRRRAWPSCCRRRSGGRGEAGASGEVPVRIVVTGAAGFIGAQIARQLVDLGHDVVGLDALDPSVHDGMPDGLADAVDHRWVDVTTPRSWLDVLDGADAVCHQAAKVGLGADFADVRDYVWHNDVGTAVGLWALHQVGFRGRLVVASSMVVYGEGSYACATHGPSRPGPRLPADLEAGQFEPRCPHCHAPLVPGLVTEDAPTDPRNVYAATKLHQEHLATAFGRPTTCP